MRLRTGKIIAVISSTPFMPKTIATGQGSLEVKIPDGYSIAIGTMMQKASLGNIITTGKWKVGLRTKPKK
jgi:hypothetical protein